MDSSSGRRKVKMKKRWAQTAQSRSEFFSQQEQIYFRVILNPISPLSQLSQTQKLLSEVTENIYWEKTEMPAKNKNLSS